MRDTPARSLAAYSQQFGLAPSGVTRVAAPKLLSSANAGLNVAIRSETCSMAGLSRREDSEVDRTPIGTRSRQARGEGGQAARAGERNELSDVEAHAKNN
jgi:hypothetical protein